MRASVPSMTEFLDTLDFSLRGFHSKEYFLSSRTRQHLSLLAVISKMPYADAKILSLGAGGAFVEEYLAKTFGASVTVADFPMALELNSTFYNSIFDDTMPIDLIASTLDFGVDTYDAVLWFDNLEHLPRDPKEVISAISASLKPGGYVFLTTDNIARVSNIAKLILGRNIQLPADRMFSEVSFENEGVHRREYTATELTGTLAACGLSDSSVKYLWQRPRTSLMHKLAFSGIESVAPRFRPHMLISARKPV